MKRRKSFTLVEILIATAIFAIAIVTLFGSFSLALKFGQRSREAAIAATIAEEKIESLRLAGFDSVALDSNPTATANSKLSQGYTKTYVEYYQGNTRIKQVTVKVYWQSRPEAIAITLVTLIGQGGIHG